MELLVCLVLLAFSTGNDGPSVWLIAFSLIIWTKSMLEKTTDTTVRIFQQFIGVVLVLEGILFWVSISASRHWLLPRGGGVITVAIGIFLFWLSPPVLIVNPDDSSGKSGFTFQKLFGISLAIMGAMQVFWTRS